jgi:hypothetical protein
MRRAFAAIALSGVVAACSSDKSTPVSPTPTINLAGTWTGDITALGSTARMSWALSQSDTAVSGPALLALPSGTVLLNGFVTGTLNGTTLAYTISVGPGGVPSQPACAGQIAGTMTATIGTPSTLSGPSAVTTSNCTQPFPGGTLTLTRP